jgi:hypothetical protein
MDNPWLTQLCNSLVAPHGRPPLENPNLWTSLTDTHLGAPNSPPICLPSCGTPLGGPPLGDPLEGPHVIDPPLRTPLGDHSWETPLHEPPTLGPPFCDFP